VNQNIQGNALLMGVAAVHPALDCNNQHAVEQAWAQFDAARIAHLLPKPSAPSLLQKAADHMAERGKQYDKPDGERSMGKAVQAFNAITGRDLSEPEGWLLLQVLKDVRLFQRDGYHADSAEDCIAYAALKAEAKARE
jgi:hypothetical protein